MDLTQSTVSDNANIGNPQNIPTTNLRTVNGTGLQGQGAGGSTESVPLRADSSLSAISLSRVAPTSGSNQGVTASGGSGGLLLIAIGGTLLIAAAVYVVRRVR